MYATACADRDIAHRVDVQRTHTAEPPAFLRVQADSTIHSDDRLIQAADNMDLQNALVVVRQCGEFRECTSPVPAQ